MERSSKEVAQNALFNVAVDFARHEINPAQLWKSIEDIVNGLVQAVGQAPARLQSQAWTEHAAGDIIRQSLEQVAPELQG